MCRDHFVLHVHFFIIYFFFFGSFVLRAASIGYSIVDIGFAFDFFLRSLALKPLKINPFWVRFFFISLSTFRFTFESRCTSAFHFAYTWTSCNEKIEVKKKKIAFSLLRSCKWSVAVERPSIHYPYSRCVHLCLYHYYYYYYGVCCVYLLYVLQTEGALAGNMSVASSRRIPSTYQRARMHEIKERSKWISLFRRDRRR